MESNPKEHADKENAGCEEASQDAVDCLGVPLILAKVLRHLSNADLLTLSLVNKLWNYEARSVLRKRDSLTASLKYSYQRLTRFTSGLHQMNVVPFSGISFRLAPRNRYVCLPPLKEELLDSSHRILLDRLQWKHLSITMFGFCKKCQQFPACRLLKTILKEKCGILEELSLSLDSKARTAFIADCLQGCSFPRLRVLKLGQLRGHQPSRKDAENVKALVSLTPNLQELRIPEWGVEFRENLAEGTSAMILSNRLILNYQDNHGYKRFTDTVRFERLILGGWPGVFNLRKFNSMIPDLLQRSSTTLKSLCLSSALAVPLMFHAICLDNVRKLTFCLDVDRLEPRIMGLLKTFDFTRTFPNLDRVITGYFECDSLPKDDINNIVDFANESWKEPLPNRAVKIKHLSVSKALNESSASFLAEMLPQINILSVDPIDTYIPFGLIWEHWADLKELHVQSYHFKRPGSQFVIQSTSESSIPNLDGDFCGIFPEEVAELRQKDDEYLRKVNIVPVKPSISCLKDLETFKLYLQPRSSQDNSNVLDPSALRITQVSGLIAFARCPDLSVTIQTVSSEDAQALCSLKPYATVVHVGLNIWPWNDMEHEMK